MKKLELFVVLVAVILLMACNTFYNDDPHSEYYDKGHSTINVVYRIKHNEQKGIPFILNIEKSNMMKEKHGTEYIYLAKDGNHIKIVAVFKIFNESDQSVYYILENEERKPVANIKLLTNKRGKVINVEVADGKSQ